MSIHTLIAELEILIEAIDRVARTGVAIVSHATRDELADLVSHIKSEVPEHRAEAPAAKSLPDSQTAAAHPTTETPA